MGRYHLKKRILVVTERRADYSKFRPILTEIKKSKKLDYFLVVTGSHLLKEHGLIIKEIKKDGFKISSTFQMYERKKTDSGFEMAKSLGKCLIELSKIIKKIKPDIILAGFDIGANLAAAIVGAHTNIIVAHVEGGDVTGTIDESIRHAITKFAHIHFSSNKKATTRIIKMGENPRLVFTVGSPVIDSIKSVKTIPIKKLETKFNLDLKKPFVLVLQHTVTTEINEIDLYIENTLGAIKELNLQALVIYGNADAGSQKILKTIKNSQIQQIPTISFNEYINLLKHSSALVGNSSSGIIETPFLHIPTINIGTRQQGRLKAENIIDVPYHKNEIKKAILKALGDKKFLKKVINSKSLHGNSNASKKIVQILEEINLKSFPIQKKLAY